MTMRELRVARAERIAEDVHLFEFRDPNGGELPAFTPGAHVEVRTPAGLERKYSLCNDPIERDRYVIAVKR
ncbi:MAG TPA: oxidoreductase, partial [Beijerinckiaceae bacterium]